MSGNRYITKNLVDTEVDLFYKGVPIPLVRELGRIFYVSVNGSDATGRVGRLDRPFKTISAALTQASSNDMIHLLSGTYTENINTANTGKNITLYFDHAKLVGSVTTNHLLRIVSNGTGHIIGKVTVAHLVIRNMYRIENTDTVIECGGHPSSCYIDGVQEIYQSAGSGVTINSFALTTPNYWRNIGSITSQTSNIFAAFRGRLENIGRIEAITGSIGLTTEDAIEADNVFFKSTNRLFNFRNQWNFFKDCIFQSTTSYLTGDTWNAKLHFENCKFHLSAPYAIHEMYPFCDRLTVRNCQWNVADFIRPATLANPINFRDFAFNEYNSDLVLPSR
jgi:hypothetical protein